MRSPARRPARAAGDAGRTAITSESPPVALRSDRPITSRGDGAARAAPPPRAGARPRVPSRLPRPPAPAPPDAPGPEDDAPLRGSVSEACSGLPKRTIDSLIVAPGACARRICCQSRGARTGRSAAVVMTSPMLMCAAPFRSGSRGVDAPPFDAPAAPAPAAPAPAPRTRVGGWRTHAGHGRRRDVADDDASGRARAGGSGDRGRHRLDVDSRFDGDDAFTIGQPRRARHQRVGGHDEQAAGVGERHADEAAGQREEQRAGLRGGGAAQDEHGLIPSRVRLGRIPAHELRPDRRPIGCRLEDRDVAGRIERRGRRLHGNFRRGVAGHAHDRQAALLVARDDAVGGNRRAGDRFDARARRERHEREIVADQQPEGHPRRMGQHDRALELAQQVAQHGRQFVERGDARQPGQRLGRRQVGQGPLGKAEPRQQKQRRHRHRECQEEQTRFSRRMPGWGRFGHSGQSVPRARRLRHIRAARLRPGLGEGPPPVTS